MRISLVQLGCPKNIVDGEWALGQLLSSGHTLSTYEEADAVFINTCGFVEAAKEESITRIAEAARDKSEGRLKKVIVFGCLSERYREQLEKEFPEIDGFFPLSALKDAARMAEGGSSGFVSGDLPLPEQYGKRFRITPPHLAYAKIADGCSHGCTFCAIPMIRGKFRSRKIGSITAELGQLRSEGVKEAVLVSQDSTNYGRDTGEGNICDLIRAIEKSPTPEWIRLLYLYPTKITSEFISLVADSGKVLPYFDIPLQHSSKKVLTAMGRGGDHGSYLKLIAKIRKAVPGAAIRSSFIVGFPAEGRPEFRELRKFLSEAELDNVGFFVYSPEEGTRAFKLEGGVGPDEASERLGELAELQKRISLKNNRARLKRTYRVLAEGFSEETDLLLEGRAYFQAPDIDGRILINRGEAARGEFCEVRITKAMEYDLIGEIVGTAR